MGGLVLTLRVDLGARGFAPQGLSERIICLGEFKLADAQRLGILLIEDFLDPLIEMHLTAR